MADLLETGAVIVEGVLDADLLGRFNTELDPLLVKVSPKRAYLNPAINFFYGDHVRQITSLASDSRVFGEEILPHPFYDEICDRVLSSHCSAYQLRAGLRGDACGLSGPLSGLDDSCGRSQRDEG